MTDRNKGYRLFKAGLMVMALMLPYASVLAGYGSLLINISGTITANTCTVNNAQPVTAEFGSVQIAELDKATASVPISITCDEAPATNALTLGVKGNTTSFNTDAFSTDVTGLGITLTSPGPAYGLNLPTGSILHPAAEGYVVTGVTSANLTTNFILTAHLVKDSNVSLKGGEFNGTATLRLNVD